MASAALRTLSGRLQEARSLPAAIQSARRHKLHWTATAAEARVTRVRTALMFEKLLAGPPPWLYGHVYLEGGVSQ